MRWGLGASALDTVEGSQRHTLDVPQGWQLLWLKARPPWLLLLGFTGCPDAPDLRSACTVEPLHVLG